MKRGGSLRQFSKVFVLSEGHISKLDLSCSFASDFEGHHTFFDLLGHFPSN